jgi:hypothetical protein
VVCIVITAWVAAGCGSGESPDARAAHAYIAALDVAETTTAAERARANAAGEALIVRVARGCPGVLHGIAGTGGALREEATDALMIARHEQAAETGRRFLATMRPLSFAHTTRATQELRNYAAAISARLALSPPDLCADARAYARSGGKRVAPGTIRAEEAEEAATEWLCMPAFPEGGCEGESLQALVERFESATERRAREARRKEDLDGAPARAFAHEQADLVHALGLT